MEKRLDISVVVPLYNEEESLPELTAWIDRVARENGLSYEIVFVDDGSTDGSWETLERLKEHYPDLFNRAATLEENAMPYLKTVKGLGRSYSWKEQFGKE